MKNLLVILLLAISVSAFGMPPTTYYVSISDGSWSNTGTWDTGTVPANNQTNGNDDITIDHNVTLTGILSVKSGTVLTINVGDTLTINGDVDFSNGCFLNINGVLIINGDVTNSNNSDGIVVNGSIIIDGDYDGGNGSDLTGTGNMDISGSVSTDGDATVFGSEVDCTTDCDNSADSPLPIELVSFDCSVENERDIVIDWVTASEINNDYFDLYKSYDGINWFCLGSIHGAGNSNTLVFYSFYDGSIIKDDNYYQLRQVDFDGNYSDSKIVYCEDKTKKVVVELQFYNLSGQKVDCFRDSQILIVIETYEDGTITREKIFR